MPPVPKREPQQFCRQCGEPRDASWPKWSRKCPRCVNDSRATWWRRAQKRYQNAQHKPLEPPRRVISLWQAAHGSPKPAKPEPDWTYRAWIRTQKCIVQIATGSDADCNGVIECCHVGTVGARHGDLGNCFPACYKHHRCGQHMKGIESWPKLYGLDLDAEGEKYLRAYLIEEMGE